MKRGCSCLRGVAPCLSTGRLRGPSGGPSGAGSPGAQTYSGAVPQGPQGRLPGCLLPCPHYRGPRWCISCGGQWGAGVRRMSTSRNVLPKPPPTPHLSPNVGHCHAGALAVGRIALSGVRKWHSQRSNPHDHAGGSTTSINPKTAPPEQSQPVPPPPPPNGRGSRVLRLGTTATDGDRCRVKLPCAASHPLQHEWTPAQT